MDKWRGKVALVTGSSAGIGASITKALANAGMIVIGLGRRVDAIEVGAEFPISNTVFQPICTAISQSSMRCMATTTKISGFTDFVVLPLAIHTLTSVHSLISNKRSPLHTLFNQALKSEISNGSGGQIVARKCDVTDEAQLLLTFKWIKSEYGRLDVLVNNAGVIKSDMVLGMRIDCYRFSAGILITKIYFIGRWLVFRWTFG